MPSNTKTKILIFAALVVFVCFSVFFQKTVKGFFYAFSSPIQKVFWQAGDNISGFLATLGNLNNLKAENDQSQKIIQELLAEKAFLTELKKENETLKDALQIGLQEDFYLALVEVIGKDIDQESILINQGARDGLSLDMPVITQQKILLGKISEVFENFSRVILISNKKSVFDVKVSGTETTGVVRGKGNSKIELDLVPQDKILTVNDLIVSSSLGGIYPAGLLVGKVNQVSRHDVSPFYQAEILPLFDLRKTSAVFVILNFIND
ncbi:MAG: rod shape-determining protein MreC [bacterium]